MIYIGVDHSKCFSQYTIGDENGNIFKRAKVMNQAGEIKQLMGSLPDQPKAAALEASRAWGWLYDELEKYADHVLLGNPLQMKAIAHAKVKTDSIDSETIYHLLRANLLPTCYVPPPEVRQVKDQLRFRGQLVTLRTTVKNQIHVLIDRNHVLQPGERETKDLFCKKGLEVLRGVCLPERQKQILDELLCLLDFLQCQINKTDDWVETLYQGSVEAKLLDTIPGLGHFLSVWIRYEIGCIERFPKAKKLCAYAGLVPSTYASGNRCFQGRITKRGNAHLRWAMTEAVTNAVRVNAIFRSHYERIRQKQGVGVGRVAVARKLLEWVYRVWKSRQTFDEATSHATLRHA